MNRLPYLWVALVLLCISACTRTEQSAAPEADQTQDLPPAVSPFPPTDPPQPPLVTPFDSDYAKALQKAWADHLGTPVQITNAIGMKFNLIPPGEFVMGSPESEPGRGTWETQHRVQITKPFYLSAHEVTQEQYEHVMGKNPSDSKGPTKPVETVNWHDAVAFCSKLSKREGVGYRLPTEAEWEYACRAGTTTTYSFGDDRSRLGEYAWYFGNLTDPNALISNETPHPVGELKPNAWGLFDMHGNVKEWCRIGMVIMRAWGW